MEKIDFERVRFGGCFVGEGGLWGVVEEGGLGGVL